GASPAGATDRLERVHEYEARRRRLGVLEEVTHARGADTDEHLDEIGAGNGEERHAGLARHGARQQCLTCARGPVEQHALRNARTQCLELLRVLEELLDLL